MALPFLFNSKFEALVSELGLTAFDNAIRISELNSIRDNSKNTLFANPEAAATRAFRELFILNKNIPIEQRVELSFKNRFVISAWCIDKKINGDLFSAFEDSLKQLVGTYVDEQYENEFYSTLANIFGVMVPIKHYMLRTIALGYLYGRKKSNISPSDAAVDLYKNTFLKDSEKYISCLTEQGQEALRALADGYIHPE